LVQLTFEGTVSERRFYWKMYR